MPTTFLLIVHGTRMSAVRMADSALVQIRDEDVVELVVTLFFQDVESRRYLRKGVCVVKEAAQFPRLFLSLTPYQIAGTQSHDAFKFSLHGNAFEFPIGKSVFLK